MWYFLAIWFLAGIATLVVASSWHTVHVNLKNLLLCGVAGPILSLYVLLLVACFFYTVWYEGDRRRVLSIAPRRE